MSTIPVPAPFLIYRFVKETFPEVKKLLGQWEATLSSFPDPVLAEQAGASLQRKAFHCLGGSIYSLYPGVSSQQLLRFIVAYQTISDYLDNLVDGVVFAKGKEQEQAFAQLHQAMLDALNPESVPGDYYAYYPYCRDGGYLTSLVTTCQGILKGFPSYHLVKPKLLWFADHYSSLQTNKHLEVEIREEKMRAWLAGFAEDYPKISPWELAAASGSTLGIFCLASLATKCDLKREEVEKALETYFPWINGLHILLDYFIDLQEDEDTKQLNFVGYYEDQHMRKKRITYFLQESLERAKTLPYPGFHKTIILGLLAMYLSDEKAFQAQLRETTNCLIKAGGLKAGTLLAICKQLRRKAVLY